MLGIISWILTPVVPFQGFNGADLRNVCTEAGMAAIRAERDYVIQEDFMKVRFHHLSLHLPHHNRACLVLTVPPFPCNNDFRQCAS